MSPRATDAACAFCEIVAGRALAHLVISEQDVVAFLDVRPLFRGHTLLVPRAHVETLADLPPVLGPAFLSAAQGLQRAVEGAAGADGSLVIVNNVVSQSVPHLHLHVIPRRRGDGLRFWLGPRTRYDSEADADAMAAAIALRWQGVAPSG